MIGDIVSAVHAPALACDCQVHIFGDPAEYPLSATRAYDPPRATLDDLDAAHRAAGVERVVLVQATAYGVDHRLLLDSLARRPGSRGVATVDDSVSDADLQSLHDAGVRGARFGLGSSLQKALDFDQFKRSIERIAGFGWHTKIVANGADLVAYGSWLRDLPTPLVLDHLGGASMTAQDEAARRLVLDLLRRDDVWIMISNADRRSSAEAEWSDMAPLVEAVYEAAPDRTIWATDWPHLRYAKPRTPSISELIGFLIESLPDAAAVHKTLVENPARLYGFAG